MPRSRQHEPVMQVSKSGWRVFTLGLVVLALALVVVLLAQTSLDGSEGGSRNELDPLTALALVLAVIAFFVQIFVFIFETSASSEAVVRSEELNAETRQVLEKIEATSQATQQVLFAQFDRLLDYVVGPGVAPPPGDTGDSTDLEEATEDPDAETPLSRADVERMIVEGVARGRPTFPASGRASEAGAKSPISDESRRMLDQLRQWPSREEAEAAIELLRGVTPLAAALLTRFGTSEISQRTDGKRVGLRPSVAGDPVRQELLQAGLLAPDGDNFNVLTAEGRSAARLLPIGKIGDPPEWWSEVVARLRNE